MRVLNLFKSKFTFILIVVVCVSTIIYAHSTGITGRTLKNGTGCNCHAENPSTNVTVLISGPSQVQVNSTNTYTLTITGGPLAGAGTNIAASTGALSVISNDLQLIGDELTHTLPKTALNNSVIFQFNYTAPATEGAITLYANGNSVNLNGNNTGDEWNFAPNFTLNVVNTTDVKDEGIVNAFSLEQNYPNPFNPSTNISFTLPQTGNVKLNIYDALGNLVETLFNGNLNEGSHQVTFNSNGLTSGVYYYSIIYSSDSKTFTDTKKMILLK